MDPETQRTAITAAATLVTALLVGVFARSTSARDARQRAVEAQWLEERQRVVTLCDAIEEFFEAARTAGPDDAEPSVRGVFRARWEYDMTFPSGSRMSEAVVTLFDAWLKETDAGGPGDTRDVVRLIAQLPRVLREEQDAQAARPRGVRGWRPGRRHA